jgi:hypothetical protein
MAADWGMIGGWVFSVVTAVFAYKAAVRQHSETTMDSDKSILVTAVTAERAKWRDDLRKAVAEFCSISIEQSPNLPRLQQAKTEILLRLNPRCNDPTLAQRHKFDREITDAVKAIFAAAAVNGPVPASSVERLEVSAQELLKQEWEKSKTEAVSGKVK